MNLRNASRPLRRLWISLAVLLLLSCSATTRYEVLSFFFDGLQPPEEMTELEPAAAPDAVTTATLAGAAPMVPAFLQARSTARGSRHVPFGTDDCRMCHVEAEAFAPREHSADVCYQCHGEQARAENWNHGPISLNSCEECHNAHESPYPFLLSLPIPDLCLYCHTSLEVDGEFYHPDLGIRSEVDMGNCIACHSPHRV